MRQVPGIANAGPHSVCFCCLRQAQGAGKIVRCSVQSARAAAAQQPPASPRRHPGRPLIMMASSVLQNYSSGENRSPSMVHASGRGAESALCNGRPPVPPVPVWDQCAHCPALDDGAAAAAIQ